MGLQALLYDPEDPQLTDSMEGAKR